MLLDMRRASRCHARSKRSGLQCRAPTVRGYSASAGCTGPPARLLEGNRNVLKRGEFTAEAMALRREVFALARMARETLAAIE
jgi:hypothetical protein